MDDKNVKNPKGTKKCVIKRILKCNDYKDCLFKNKIKLKFSKDSKVKHVGYILKKSCNHSNDDKRLQTLTELQHIHMEQMLLKYMKVRCYVNIND